MTRTWSGIGPTKPSTITVQRLLDIFGEPLFVFASKSGWRLADRDDVFDEGDRYPAVRPHWHGDSQFGVAPNEDVQAVAGADAIFRGWQRRSGRGGRQLGCASASRQDEADSRQPKEKSAMRFRLPFSVSTSG